MSMVKVLGVVAILAGLLALAVTVAPSAYGQTAAPRPGDTFQFPPLEGPGSRIGASIRDLEGSEFRDGGGVFVEEVRSGSPAEKAGLKRSDIITRFDEETVRSARQFARLVGETPPGRSVRVTIARDGRATDLSMTPEAGRQADVPIETDRDRVRRWIERSIPDGERLRERGRQFAERIPFDFGLPPSAPRIRLGVEIHELTPQLAEYFGVKEGVLVSSVSDGSPASRAGMRAGDVIASINGERVQSRGDLLRRLQTINVDTDVTIGIVRDKKEISIKTKVEGYRPQKPV